MDVLPAEAFWVGLISYPIGGYLFFMGSREAIQKAERRTSSALRPRISNEAGEAYAEQQVQRLAQAPPSIQERVRAHAAQIEQVVEDEIVLYEVDDDEAMGSEDSFRISSDVSFPLEIQEQTSLAEQLDKLNRLREEGVINAQEFAAAKAKLLK
jgi:hypothetical protein